MFILSFQSLLFAEAVREIPKHLYDQYTLNGQIPVIDSYQDDSYPNEEPLFYSITDIDVRLEIIGRRETEYYGQTDKWLYEALDAFPIKGKEVAIIGSASPWYESVVIAFGGIPTTIEYDAIITDDPRLTILTMNEYKNKPKKFDIVLTISSIEHDGLGRYGDPLNPSGDLEFMTLAKEVLLKPNGRMILSTPIGQDVLTWNCHRVYGPIRLPLLLSGWTVIETFGFTTAEFKGAFGNYAYQPVFYLSPN